MKNLFAFVFCLLSFVLASSVPAMAAKVPVEKRIAAEYAAQAKELGKKYSYDQTIEIYRKIRAKDEYATNAAARAYIAGEIIKQCKMPYWPNLKYWNAGLQAQIPVEAKAMLADSGLKFAEKVPFAAALSCHLASEDRDFAGAQRVLDDLKAAYPQATVKELAPLEIAYSNLYRWQDRFDDAWAALDRAVRGDAKAAGMKAISLAIDTGDWAKAHAIWAKGLGVAEELLALAGNERRPADTFDRAEAFVRDAKNPLADRLRIVVAYFCTDRSPRQRELRALVKDADKKKVSRGGAVLWAYQFAADYALALELEEYFGIVYTDKTPADACRRHILSLAAVGRKDEAAKFAAARAAVADVKPEDVLKYRILEAMLTGGDVAAVIASAKLPNLETAKLWRSAARAALVTGDMDAAERFSAAYLGCLVKLPGRRMAVRYFDEPISSVADWRKIRDRLDPQLCDRKYGLSFEAMATDVATGREAIEASALDSNAARLELTTACDRFGLHIFMRVEDPNALAVRDGFAGGITAETFLAPGRGEPYVCFGVSAAKGIEYSFQTMYDNATATRPDVDRKKGDDSFRLERVFAEGEYVVHLFFDWETYATKIPVNGSVWRLGCNARSAQGAYTWGGSNGPHETSAWGDLVFELSDKAVADIRRQALYKVRGRWRKTGRLDVFDTWANGGIGDAAFAREVLAPLEKELDGLMAGVTPEMTDADANRIFEQGYVRIQGLKHEIDRLRQDYLKRKLTEPDAE